MSQPSEPPPPAGTAPRSGADNCPRCGGGFHCGATDAAPCPCSSVTLSPALQANLRQHYALCLCLPCLLELTQGGPVMLPTKK